MSTITYVFIKKEEKCVSSRKHAYIVLTLLNPFFYIVKLGFTGIYLIFLISAQKYRLWVLVLTSTHNLCLSRNMKNFRIFI